MSGIVTEEDDKVDGLVDVDVEGNFDSTASGFDTTSEVRYTKIFLESDPEPSTSLGRASERVSTVTSFTSTRTGTSREPSPKKARFTKQAYEDSDDEDVIVYPNIPLPPRGQNQKLDEIEIQYAEKFEGLLQCLQSIDDKAIPIVVHANSNNVIDGSTSQRDKDVVENKNVSQLMPPPLAPKPTPVEHDAFGIPPSIVLMPPPLAPKPTPVEHDAVGIPPSILGLRLDRDYLRRCINMDHIYDEDAIGQHINEATALATATRIAIPSPEIAMPVPVYIFGGKEYVALTDYPNLRLSTTTGINTSSSIDIDRSNNGNHSQQQPPRENEDTEVISSSAVNSSTSSSQHDFSENTYNTLHLRSDTPDPRASTRLLIESEEEEYEENGPEEVSSPPPRDIFRPAHIVANSESEDFSELEVASDSDLPENPVENHDSSSASPSDRRENFGSAVNRNSTTHMNRINMGGKHFPTTASDDNTSIDEADQKSSFVKSVPLKHQCAQCDAKIPSVFIYCLRCFKIRRNWLPKRPVSRRLKKRKKMMMMMHGRMDADSLMMDPNENPPMVGRIQIRSRSPVIILDRVDAPRHLPSVQNIDLNNAFIVSEDNPALHRLKPSSLPGNITICELLTPPSGENTTGEGNLDAELKEILTSLNLLPKVPQSRSVESYDKIGSTSSSDTCCICCSRPKNAAFVHNKIAHLCCCYICGDKILKRDGKCPICRERVLRLVKMINV